MGRFFLVAMVVQRVEHIFEGSRHGDGGELARGRGGRGSQERGMRELGSGEAGSVLVAGLSGRGTTWQTRAVGGGSMAVCAWMEGGPGVRQSSQAGGRAQSWAVLGGRWREMGWDRMGTRERAQARQEDSGGPGRGAFTLLQKMTHRAWGTCNTRRPNPGGLPASVSKPARCGPVVLPAGSIPLFAPAHPTRPPWPGGWTCTHMYPSHAQRERGSMLCQHQPLWGSSRRHPGLAGS